MKVFEIYEKLRGSTICVEQFSETHYKFLESLLYAGNLQDYAEKEVVRVTIPSTLRNGKPYFLITIK